MANQSEERHQGTGVDTERDVFESGRTPEPDRSDGGKLTEKREDLRDMGEAIRGLHRGADAPPPPKPTFTVQPKLPTSGVPQVPPVDGQQQQQPPLDGQVQQPHMVPLNALLDARERAQRAEAQVEHFRRQQQPAQEEQFDPEKIFTEPGAVIGAIMQQINSERRMSAIDTDLRFAKIEHKEVFDQAWQAFIAAAGGPMYGGQMNPGLYMRVMQSPQPGQEIVAWYKQQQLAAEMADPAKYREKMLREMLSDPASLAVIGEALGINIELPQQQQQSPAASPQTMRQAPVQPSQQRDPDTGRFVQARHAVRLPTSLSRVPGSSPAGDDEDNDGSEEAIWNSGRNRRR